MTSHELLISQICDTDCDAKYMIELMSSFKLKSQLNVSKQ